MRIHLRDVLPFIVLPAYAAHELTRDQTPDNTANTTDVAPPPLEFPPSQYCQLMHQHAVKSYF
jgi:hypothetical protein